MPREVAGTGVTAGSGAEQCGPFPLGHTERGRVMASCAICVIAAVLEPIPLALMCTAGTCNRWDYTAAGCVQSLTGTRSGREQCELGDWKFGIDSGSDFIVQAISSAAFSLVMWAK